MARRSSGGNQTIGKSLRQLFTELAFIAVILSVVYFVIQVFEIQTVSQYVTLANITLQNSTGYFRGDAASGYYDVSSEVNGIRSGFTVGKGVVTLGLGLLGLVMVVLVFAGYLIPVIQSMF